MKKVLLIFLSFLCLQVNAQTNADNEYKEAEIHFKVGFYERALKHVNNYVTNGGDVDKAIAFKKKIKECKEVFDKAESLYQAKRYQEAITQYEKLQKLNPSHPDIDSKIATCRNGIKAQEERSRQQQQQQSQSSQTTTKPATQTQSTPIQSSSSSSRGSSYTVRKKSNPLEPERFTMEFGLIGGTNLGVSMDFTASYFLIGFGVDWIMITPERTKTTNLVNSGYTGNFTKQTTINLSGSCTNVFLDLGAYFKYFSVSCQVGLLCGTTVERTSLYNGSGYGLVDGDLNEYWGSYAQRSFANSTSDKELHMTLTPQVKGYIPIGNYSLSLGLGYTFIPTLGYSAGLSGNLGFHIRF